MIRRFTLLTFLFFICLQTDAQLNARAYETAESYINNKPVELKVKIFRADIDDTSAFATYEYIITNHDDKKIYKQIHNSWLIECDSYQYINSGKILKNNLGFSRILYSTPDYLYFRGTYGKVTGIRKENKKGVVLVPVGGGPILGAAAVVSTTIAVSEAIAKQPVKALTSRNYDYIYNLHSKQVEYFNRGLMRRYLEDAINKKDTASAIFFTNLIKRNEQEEEWRIQQKENEDN